jgi:hypothetical protein
MKFRLFKRKQKEAKPFVPSQDVEQFFTDKGVKVKNRSGLYPLAIYIGNTLVAGALWVEVGAHEDGKRKIVTYGVYKDRS